ncbi:MAG: polyprenol phosphomannose-dependent alpha 1,6 mannosyltransferase MptB [Propionibacteriaceae bacterium]
MTLRRSYAGLTLGTASTLCLALGNTASHWMPANFAVLEPWRTVAAMGHPVGYVLEIVGLLGICVAFGLVRPYDGKQIDPRIIAICWFIPFVIAPPVLSRDVYAYLDQGWVVGHGDPYHTPMGTVSPYAYLVDDFWRGTTPVYPPLALAIQWLMVVLGRGHVVATVLLMRLPVVCSLAVLSEATPRLTKRIAGTVKDPARIRWFILLNPIVVVHLMGGGHNDAAMIALVVLACLLATTKYGFWTGSLVAGLAMAAKQPGLMAAVLVALLAYPGLSFIRRCMAAVGAIAVALASFVAVSVGTGMGFGWIGANGSPTKALTQSPASLIRLIFGEMIPGLNKDLFYAILIGISGVALVVVLAWLWLKLPDYPLAIGAWGFLAFTLLGPGLQAWYIVPALAFIAMLPMSKKQTALLSGYGMSLLLTNWFASGMGRPMLMAFLWTLPVAIVTAIAVFLWKQNATSRT